MPSKILIIDPRTDGADVRQAEIAMRGAWVEISCKDIIIKVLADDIIMIAGDEGHG